MPRWALLVLVVALCAGTYLRLAGVSGQALAGDEPIAYPTIREGYGAVLSTYDGRGSHPGYSFVQKLCLDELGTNVLAYRLPSLLAGLLALYLFYPLGRRWVGRWPAWLATLLLCVNSLHVYHSRSARAYALAFLLMLLVLAAAHAALNGRRWAWGAVAALSAVLPWIHLTAAAPLVLLALVCLAWTWFEHGPLRLVLAALAAGFLVTLLLYLPTWSGFSNYVLHAEREGDFEARWGGTLQALGGTLAGGAWFLAGGLLGTFWLLRRARREGLMLGALVVAAPLAILLVRPRGGDMALSRYFMISLAPMLLASSFAWFALARAVVGWLPRGDAARTATLTRIANGVAALAGLAFVLFQVAGGPLDSSWLRGTFTNAPEVVLAGGPPEGSLARAPELYRELAAAPRGLTIVEYPSPGFARAMLRRYELFHGQNVLVGTDRGEPIFAAAPYVSVLDRAALVARADWLVLHLDIGAEYQDFRAAAGQPVWRFAYPLEARAAELIELLGPPDYRDGRVLAWRFTRP